MTVTVDLPDDVKIPEGFEKEAQKIVEFEASRALRNRFAYASEFRNAAEALDRLIGTFRSQPREDGRSWSQIKAASTPFGINHGTIC